MAPREKCQPNFTLFFFRDPASETMQIPSELSKHLTEPLPKKIVFRNNSGNLWRMILRRTNECLFLEKGWKKFATDNDLTTGERLLLEYDGIRTFNVRIFGWSGSEVIRSKVEIEEIGSDEEEHEEYIDLSYSSEEEEKTDSEGERVSSREKQSQRLQERKKKAHGCSSGAQGLSHGRCSAIYDEEDDKKYPSGPSNPLMLTRLSNRTGELYVKSKIINGHGLKFPKVINFMDSFGKVKGRTVNRSCGRLFIKGWINVCRRNYLATNDEIICEFQNEKGWVHSIKIHVIRDRDKAI